MTNYRTSRIIPVVLVVVIIIIAIAAIVSLARVVFFSGTTDKVAVLDISRDALLNSSVGHSISMTVRGPIVADEEFHSYALSVSPDVRTITTYTGYLNTTVDQKALGNNVAAYEEFVHALDKANLAKGEQLDGDKNDTRGICATGSVYEFSILNNGETVKKLWTSTCGGSKGSLDASVTQLTSLFVRQIPDADLMIRKISL